MNQYHKENYLYFESLMKAEVKNPVAVQNRNCKESELLVEQDSKSKNKTNSSKNTK